MNRRNFIKNGSLCTSTLLLSGALWSNFANTKNDKVYRIGIIGFGDRGSGLFNVLKDFPGKFVVNAICDPLDFRLDNAKKMADTNKVKLYRDHRKLLENKNVDAVIISTPLNTHYEIAKNSLEAGKHVYLEKAMTFTVDQAMSLTRIAEKHPNQTLQIGHQYRYSPLYYKVKKMIQDGYLGKVVQIDARWDRNWNWRRPVPDPSLERKINWRMYKEYSGGLPAELLSHQMDYIHWAFDALPTTVYGTGGIDFYKDSRETYDNVQLNIRYEQEDMIGNFGATCANKNDGYSFRIKGSKGMVSLLTDDGIFYPETETRKELEEVDGVSGATKIAWTENKNGISLVDSKLKDGSFYAFEDFYKAISENSLPDSNVYTGGNTAICVALANDSIYNGGMRKWKPEYNLSPQY
ncbi:Gfo/Idh/MocA family oxidoreductase [Galbibacter sp. EGI 63066]|uniref:Gfo/Idh/MocA family protein n=1 Tax=Galbibacter sp. EGI 63066 TaxID=2993559 RepID=UPI0022498E0B|nr:Gfo/Idh/MocA family oxidoreductase [Galbibacter sp. EGI 63066]MCX2678992.1 Gfo/Idh/MocA family oxidoreductase [Galbibacter sp. EGI 63066]